MPRPKPPAKYMFVGPVLKEQATARVSAYHLHIYDPQGMSEPLKLTYPMLVEANQARTTMLGAENAHPCHSQKLLEAIVHSIEMAKHPATTAILKAIGDEPSGKDTLQLTATDPSDD